MAIDTTEVGLYGINRGGAQVWGKNKALGQLQQQYEQDRLRKQREEAQLGDELGKINLDAAREADLPELMKKYNGVKETFFKLRQTKDNMERMKLQSQLMNQKQELLNGTGLSKQAQAQEAEFGKLPLNHADDINDDFVPNYSKLRKTSIFSPEYKTQAEYLSQNALLPKFDQIGVAKKITDASIQNIAESAVKKQALPDGTVSYYTESGKKLDRNAIEQNVLTEVNGGRNKGLLRFLDKSYPDMPITDKVKAYADDLYESNKGRIDKLDRTGAASRDPNAWREKMLLAAALRKDKAEKPSDDAALYRQKTIDDMIGGVEGSGERVKAVLSATGNYTDTELNRMIGAPKGSNFIEFRVPKKTITYNNTEGDPVTKTFEARTVLIDKRKPDSKLKLNQLLNDLTGEKISESKVQTGNAGGKVKGEVFTEKGKQIKSQSKSTVTMILPNGQSGEIPADKVDAFLKKYPKAKRQ